MRRSPAVSGLQLVERDPIATCKHCGAKAVGPCASCHAPLCGDCCILTEDGAKTWAICRDCDATGDSLSSGWRAVLSWIALPIGLLALAVVLLAWLSR